jgi:hypothetical protein
VQVAQLFITTTNKAAALSLCQEQGQSLNYAEKRQQLARRS